MKKKSKASLEKKVYGLFHGKYRGKEQYYETFLWGTEIVYNDRFEAQRKLDEFVSWIENESKVKHLKIYDDELEIWKTLVLPDHLTSDDYLNDPIAHLYIDVVNWYFVKEIGLYGEKSDAQIVEESFSRALIYINRKYEENKRKGKEDAVFQFSDEINGSLFYIPPHKRWKVVEIDD